MKGLWNWTSNAISSVVSAIKHTASLIAATPVTIKTAYNYIREPSKNFLLQTIKGFLSFWQPSAIITALESDKIRPIVLKAFSANFIYMVLAIAFEAGRKELPKVIPAMENTTIAWGAGSIVFALDALALLYMLKKSSASYVDNTFDNVAITKVIYHEIPSTNNHGEKCDHGYTAQFQAGCASTFYYLGKMFAVWNAENAAYRYIPVLGTSAVWPLRAFANGETLVEYKLSALGNCTDCRYEKLSVNNGYSFGMGLALCGTYEIIRFCFNKFLGLENSFLADAIFNVLFQYSIISALMNDKPLPGKVEIIPPSAKPGENPPVVKAQGFEVFWPMRISAEALMTKIGAKILALYSNPDSNIDIEKQIQQVADCPPILMARTAVIDANIQSSDIVKRDSFRRAYDLYEKQVKDYLDWLVDIRNDPVKNKLPLVADYIPEAVLSQYTYGYTRGQINLAFDKRWDDVIVRIANFIKFVNTKNGRRFIKQYNDMMMNQVLQEKTVITAAPPMLEQKNVPAEENRVPAKVVEPDKYLTQELPEPAKPKDENPKPQRRIKVDRYLDGASRMERQEDVSPAAVPFVPLGGNVRLSSSGMFRRNNLSASNVSQQLSASRQAQKK